jgi:hypothetical protein
MIDEDQLSHFLGEWAGEEQLSATAWTAAGTANGMLSITSGPGGGLLIDYAEERDATRMTGHGVLSGDGWWWFDSYGFTPMMAGTAAWRDGELVLERRSDRGRTVTVLGMAGGCLQQRIDTATPAQEPLLPLLRGSYHRLRHTVPGVRALLWQA